MAITLNGTTGITTPAVTNNGAYTGDGISFADATPSNTLVTTTGGNVGIGTASPNNKLVVNGAVGVAGEAAAAIADGCLIDQTAGYLTRILNYSSTTGSAIAFYTGSTGTSTERMRIDSSGNLLVGTTNSSVSAGAGFKYISDATNPYIGMVVTSTSGSNNYHLYSTGASAFRFFVTSAGAINATSTSITGISDISLKENVRDLETGLSEVMTLKPRRFDWKEETKLHEKNVAGFIAQEVAEVLPELVYDYQYNETETKKALKMGDMLPTLVKAIQEQQAIITDLKARIETLENK